MVQRNGFRPEDETKLNLVRCGIFTVHGLKLRGCICERAMGEENLKVGKNEEGISYRVEDKINEVGKFILCIKQVFKIILGLP